MSDEVKKIADAERPAMTPLEQASAILKAAEEIVALEKRIGLKLDMAEHIEPDDYDGEEIDEANTLALAYAGRIALALIEKHRALEEAEAVVKQLLKWADSKCPCENELPNPCTLCGASVENLEACKAADATLPPSLLRAARAFLARQGATA